jgi:hypothetical protein
MRAGSCLISGLAGRIIRDQPADLIVLEHPNSAGYAKIGERFHAQAKELGLFCWTTKSR